MIRHCLAIAIVALMSGKASADAPLPPPKTKVICSPSDKFCAIADLEANTTYLRVKATGELLWSIPGWHRSIFVSDDGQTVAIGYKGLNLLPRNVTLGEPVIHLYKQGELVRTVLLGDIFGNVSELRRTVSHYAWGHVDGFNRANQLVVVLLDGNHIAFSANTGEREEVRHDPN